MRPHGKSGTIPLNECGIVSNRSSRRELFWHGFDAANGQGAAKLREPTTSTVAIAEAQKVERAKP